MTKGEGMVKKREDITGAILEYFRKNPDASDTLEGISRWWLMSEKLDATVVEVESAIEDLIVKGMIEKQTIDTGNLIYKICKKNETDSQ